MNTETERWTNLTDEETKKAYLHLMLDLPPEVVARAYLHLMIDLEPTTVVTIVKTTLSEDQRSALAAEVHQSVRRRMKELTKQRIEEDIAARVAR